MPTQIPTDIGIDSRLTLKQIKEHDIIDCIEVMGAPVIIHRIIRFLSVFTCCFLVIAVSVITSTTRVAAEEYLIDLSMLEYEMSRISYSSTGHTKIRWLPVEFWDVALEIDPMVQMLAGKQMLSTIRPYNIFVVSRATISSRRIPTYDTRTALQNNIQLIDKNGNSYSPYSAEKISGAIQLIMSDFRQSFAEDFEVDKDFLHFFLFPSHDAQEKRIADPTKKGSFSLLVGVKKFEWKLPLSELIPKKKCPVDGKLMNGNWKYCPWHGVEIQSLTN